MSTAPPGISAPRIAIVALLGPLAAALATAADDPPPLRFTPEEMAAWQAREFEGATRYRLERADGQPALIATATGSASARYHEVEVDLARYPVIEWSWRADALPTGDADERTRAGDDYVARIYLVREGFFGKLSARALNYVWARERPAGDTWANAFTERAWMVAVESGTANRGRWLTCTRNVRADWRAAFGEDIERIDGIALMTDADNTDSRARAAYGHIALRAPEGGAGDAADATPGAGCRPSGSR